MEKLLSLQQTILPVGFSVRPATIDDLQVAWELVMACEMADYGETETSLEVIRKAWLEPGYNLASDSWVVISPEGRLVASTLLKKSGQTRIYMRPHIHPDYSGLGIGSYLISLAEARARQHIPLAPAHARITLNTGIASVNQLAQQRVEREGFQLARHFWVMEIEMDALPPEPAEIEQITVRTFTPEQDERAVFDLMEDAFQDHWGHIPIMYEKWKHWTIEREDFDPTLWFLAFAGAELAGASCCMYASKEHGWVDDLGVRRPWRRKGLGQALLLHSFREFYRRGIRKVGLEVDSQNLTGATRLYERVGMHPIRQYNSYEKELRPGVELSTQSISV